MESEDRVRSSQERIIPIGATLYHDGNILKLNHPSTWRLHVLTQCSCICNNAIISIPKNPKFTPSVAIPLTLYIHIIVPILSPCVHLISHQLYIFSLRTHLRSRSHHLAPGPYAGALRGHLLNYLRYQGRHSLRHQLKTMPLGGR